MFFCFERRKQTLFRYKNPIWKLLFLKVFRVLWNNLLSNNSQVLIMLYVSIRFLLIVHIGVETFKCSVLVKCIYLVFLEFRTSFKLIKEV